MSTNDTLRGLLAEALPSIRFRRGMGLKHKEAVGDLIQRIDAALAEPVADSGIEQAAKYLEKRAADYANDLGYEDMGALSFGGGERGQIKLDHYNGLLDLADDIRGLAALNGGAVAGQCAVCHGSGVVSTTDKDHNGDHIEQRCPECGDTDCNGQCFGDDMMGDS